MIKVIENNNSPSIQDVSDITYLIRTIFNHVELNCKTEKCNLSSRFARIVFIYKTYCSRCFALHRARIT